MLLGRPLAGPLTNEPEPRLPPGTWSPFTPAHTGVEPLVRPQTAPPLQFSDVLEHRRSRAGGPVPWPKLADLLWYSAGIRGSADAGRAGLPIHWTAAPTAGGLYCLRIVCISDDGSPPKLYDPIAHRFLILAADPDCVRRANGEAVRAVTGTDQGCTLRFVGDWAKLSAAYLRADSLLFRDSGCLTATVALCAAWLGLNARPLGFLGDDLLPGFGFPTDRFRAAGAIQIGGPAAGQ